MIRIFILIVSLFISMNFSFAESVNGLKSPDELASDREATANLDQALAKMAGSDGFSCIFRQVVYFAEGGEKQYAGTLAIRRPGRFRWQYVTPYEQLYISSGNIIWHYEADLMQAERMQSLDVVDPVAMKLLDGRIGVKDIKLLTIDTTEPGVIAYKVRIHDGPELLMAFSAAGELRWLESIDMLGNRNRMMLTDVNRSVPAEDVFHFVPPAGVDVIDMVDHQASVVRE